MAAEKGEAVDKAKLKTLIGVAKELHYKQEQILQELDDLIGGAAGIAALIRRFEAAFDEAWGRRYAGNVRGRYIWRKTQDVPNIKRLVKALGIEDLEARAANYLRNDDPFITKNRHPFGLFVSGINSYANEGTAQPDDLSLDAEAPVDCRHTPRCKSEHEHTNKRIAEGRRI